MDYSLLFYIVGIASAIIVCIPVFIRFFRLVMRFLDRKEIYNSEHLRIITTKNEALKSVLEIFEEAKRGDLIYGMCKTCYFREETKFWESLEDVLEKGARLQVIISADPGALYAIDEFKKRDKNSQGRIIIKESRIANVRVMGIRGKQGLLVILSPSSKEYTAAHIKDTSTSKAICEPLFDSYWSNAEKTLYP